MNTQPAGARVYRRLVGLYPRDFRDQYGADLVQLVRDQCNDEPAWRVYSRAAIDLAITIPMQRVEAHMNRTPNHLVPLFYSAVAATGVVLAVVGGTNVAMLVIGACIAVVSATLAAIAWRRTGPVGVTIATDSWWKFVIAGPIIIAGVIVAAGIGVEAWFVGVTCVFGAFVLSGIGLLLGVARLTRRRSPTLPT